LLKVLETIISGIKNVLASEEDNSENDFYDKEDVKSELEILKKALGSFDAGTINRSVDSLGNMARAGGIKDSIQNISEKILVGEYEEAMAIIETLLKEGCKNGTL
jgi:hypothetical protein